MAFLNLPKYYDLVENDTFELFFRGIVAASDPYRYNIRIDCERGAIYRRKYVYTPTNGDAGTVPMIVSLENDEGTVLDRKELELRIHPAARRTFPKPYNVLCVGDSLTSGGIWASELYRRLTASDGKPAGLGLNVRFWGNVPGKNGAFHEGYGGWTFNSFNCDYDSARFWHLRTRHALIPSDQHAMFEDEAGASWRLESIDGDTLKLIYQTGNAAAAPVGALRWISGGESHTDIPAGETFRASGNPFWDEAAERVDFGTWARKLGCPGIDLACILLGWNSTLTSEEEYFDHVRIFLANLRETFPNVKVILMGLQVPSIDGFGASYGCMWNYMDKLRYVFRMDERYAKIAEEYDWVSSASLAGQFDTEYNMPSAEFPVNVRGTKTEIRGTNGVHPAPEGYLQIADAFYRAGMPYWNGEK